MSLKWTKKDLLSLQDLSKEEIELILETAQSFKEVSTRAIKKVPALRGKTVVNLFFEPSTRTRNSFEVAEKRLSADMMNVAIQQSSVKKGESLIDTAKNVEALKVDIVVVRHSASGSPNLLARNLKASVINAGDGSHEHPTQGLLDLYTILEKKGKIKGLNVVIVGDVAHSRVARSNIWGLTKLGANVTIVGPQTLIPSQVEELGVSISNNLEEAIEKADVIEMLRLQKERQEDNLFPTIREYGMLFGLTQEKLNKAKPDVLVMHPGPINRGIEMTSEVADGKNSVILEQVTNGIAVRMAVLYLVSGAQVLENDEQKSAVK